MQNEDDNALYCGGFGVQHDHNGGKCGICGDPWDAFPRFDNWDFWQRMLCPSNSDLNFLESMKHPMDDLPLASSRRPTDR